MIGWILLILVAVLVLYVADTIVYAVTWLAAWLDAALRQFGVELQIFNYLDIIYPYTRSGVQALGIGLLVISVLAIVLSLREQA